MNEWAILLDTEAKSLSQYVINRYTAEIRKKPTDRIKWGDYDAWTVVKNRPKNPKKSQMTRVVELSEEGSSSTTRGPHNVKNELYRAFKGEIPEGRTIEVAGDPERFSLDDLIIAETDIVKMNAVRDHMEANGWKRHPTYEHYLGNEQGHLFSLFTNNLKGGYKNSLGYMADKLFTKEDPTRHEVQRHRFIWECFNGLIDNDDEIDHIKGVGFGDHLGNLQRLSSAAHNKKTKSESATVRERIAATNAKPIYRHRKGLNGEEIDRDDFPLGAFTAKTARDDLDEVPSQDTILKYINKDLPDSNGWYWKYRPADSIEGESWRKVDWDENLKGLEVSSKGRVRSNRFFATFGSDITGRPFEKSQTYNHIGLNIKALVCEAFNGPPPAGQKREVSRRRTDIDYTNEASNLFWSTPKMRGRGGTPSYGFFPEARNNRYGEFFGKYTDDTDAAEKLNSDSSAISKVRRGITSVCGKDNTGRKRAFVAQSDADLEIGPGEKQYVRVKDGVLRATDKRFASK